MFWYSRDEAKSIVNVYLLYYSVPDFVSSCSNTSIQLEQFTLLIDNSGVLKEAIVTIVGNLTREHEYQKDSYV